MMWAKESATVREALKELNRRRKPPLAYTTVLTVITRLNTRGFLQRTPEGRGFRYSPTKSREDLLAELSDQLIDRLLNDFGEIGVARLGARIEALDAGRRRKLGRGRKTS